MLEKCLTCPSFIKVRKNGICQACIIRKFAPEKKYFWTADRETALKRAYRAKNKLTLGRNLDDLQRQTGFPRAVLIKRAAQLGLRVTTYERWTPEDIQQLQELAGQRPYKVIAKMMGRTATGIRQRLNILGIHGWITKGFSRKDLSELMGVRHAIVDTWLRKGWLKLGRDDRFPEDTVRKFLWRHMDEYRFHSCDENWLKTMLNPNIGKIPAGRDRHGRMPDVAIRRAA